MKQFTILATLLLPFLTLAHGSKNGMDGADPPANGTAKHGNGGRIRNQGPCDRFIHAEFIVKVNQNQSEMARIESKNPQRAQRLQAENANATTFVKQMESNTTFVKECQQVEAHKQFQHQCARLKHLEQEASNPANATKAEAAKTKLSQLQSNQTLVNGCKNDGGKGGKTGGGTGATAEAAKAGKNGASSLQYGSGLLALSISVFMATMAF